MGVCWGSPFPGCLIPAGMAVRPPLRGATHSQGCPAGEVGGAPREPGGQACSVDGAPWRAGLHREGGVPKGRGGGGWGRGEGAPKGQGVGRAPPRAGGAVPPPPSRATPGKEFPCSCFPGAVGFPLTQIRPPLPPGRWGAGGESGHGVRDKNLDLVETSPHLGDLAVRLGGRRCCNMHVGCTCL